MKLLYLYRELMPYNIPVLKVLNSKGVEILCIHNDIGKLTPYEPDYINGVQFIKKSRLSRRSFYEISKDFEADIIYISDRTIIEYNKIGIYYKKYGKPVISGNDSQWSKGRQWLNVLTSFMRHKQYYSHMQVAGIRQFEYAKRLGFDNDKIIWPMYSANTEIFEQIPITIERFEKAKDILFVGRFSEIKGLEYLIKAWKLIDTSGSKLHLVGNGDFLKTVELPLNVVQHKFSNQVKLLELASQCRAFVLPSLKEPWGVVLHEFAAAGLPIVATDVCGAVPHFVINNGNGFIIKPKSSQDLARRLNQVLSSSPQTLFEMALLSRQLSKSISPELIAQVLLSVTNE